MQQPAKKPPLYICLQQKHMYKGRGLSENMVCAAVSHDIYSHWRLRGNNFTTTLDIIGV